MAQVNSTTWSRIVKQSQDLFYPHESFFYKLSKNFISWQPLSKSHILDKYSIWQPWKKIYQKKCLLQSHLNFEFFRKRHMTDVHTDGSVATVAHQCHPIDIPRFKKNSSANTSERLPLNSCIMKWVKLICADLKTLHLRVCQFFKYTNWAED